MNKYWYISINWSPYCIQISLAFFMITLVSVGFWEEDHRWNAFSLCIKGTYDEPDLSLWALTLISWLRSYWSLSSTVELRFLPFHTVLLRRKLLCTATLKYIYVNLDFRTRELSVLPKLFIQSFINWDSSIFYTLSYILHNLLLRLFCFVSWEFFDMVPVFFWQTPIIVGMWWWFLCFLKHYLAFWYYKMLWPHLVYFLAQS